jgi:hypothetical protein
VPLLRALLEETRAPWADLRDRRPSHLTRQDRDRLAKILPVVAALRGSELFESRRARHFWPDFAKAWILTSESGDIPRLTTTGRNLPTEILLAVSGGNF